MAQKYQRSCRSKTRVLESFLTQALPSLIEIFHELDKDRSGLLTREEVENVPLSVLPPRVLDTIYADSLLMAWTMHGVGGSGSIVGPMCSIHAPMHAFAEAWPTSLITWMPRGGIA